MFKKILSDVFEKFLYETKVQGNVKKAASSLGFGAVISYILIRMMKNKKLGLFNDGEINQQNLTKYIKCTCAEVMGNVKAGLSCLLIFECLD